MTSQNAPRNDSEATRPAQMADVALAGLALLDAYQTRDNAALAEVAATMSPDEAVFALLHATDLISAFSAHAQGVSRADVTAQVRDYLLPQICEDLARRAG